MTHREALQLLDMAKDDQPIPEAVLTEALFMTGDGESVELCREMQEFVDALRQSGAL